MLYPEDHGQGKDIHPDYFYSTIYWNILPVKSGKEKKKAILTRKEKTKMFLYLDNVTIDIEIPKGFNNKNKQQKNYFN